MGSPAAIIEGESEFKTELGDSMDEFVDNVAEAIVTTRHGHGKFSVYFVIFATVLAIGIFAYSLVRLVRQCRREKSASERDFFCRASNDDKNNNNSGFDQQIEGVDPNGLLQ